MTTKAVNENYSRSSKKTCDKNAEKNRTFNFTLRARSTICERSAVEFYTNELDNHPQLRARTSMLLPAGATKSIINCNRCKKRSR